MSALTAKIQRQIADLDASLDKYLKGEGQLRYLAGVEVNRNAGLLKCRAEVIKGLSALQLEGYAAAKRARGLS